MSTDAPDQVPTARVKKAWWPYPIIWIVPLLAAGFAAWLIYQRHQEQGVEITIHMTDGTGIRPGETPINLFGVTVGHVHDLKISDDHKSVVVHARLDTADEFLARRSTQFWLVKPEISLTNVSGLGTIVQGPYIDCRPGEGEKTDQFLAVEHPPKTDRIGIRLILHGDRVGQITPDTAVTLHGVQVGVIEDTRLSVDASQAEASILIWDPYRYAVRTNTKFWIVKGAGVTGSVLGGINLQIDSIKALLAGGIEFSTPEADPGQPIHEGQEFELHQEPDAAWLKWRAKTTFPPEALKQMDGSSPNAVKPLPTLKKV